MLSSIRSAAVILAACAAALAGAAPSASAAETGVAGFYATFEASYTTSWSLPEHHVISDCYHQAYRSGAGQERWQIRSRGRAKVAVVRNSALLFFRFGTWDALGDPPLDGLRAGGLHTRSGSYTDRTAPGECGGTPELRRLPEQPDCGTKLPSYDIGFSASATRVRPSISVDDTRRGEDVRFDDCPIDLSDGLTDGDWPDVEATMPKRLIKSRRPVVIRATRTWKARKPTGRGHGASTTTSTLTWKLTLTPKG